MKVNHIPEIYGLHKWRNTLPVDRQDDTIGIGFTNIDEGGKVVRIRMSTHCAKHLINSLSFYLTFKKAKNEV
ncbi:MAG: hypothetical protein ABIG11_00905 [bacterium]